MTPERWRIPLRGITGVVGTFKPSLRVSMKQLSTRNRGPEHGWDGSTVDICHVTHYI